MHNITFIFACLDYSRVSSIARRGTRVKFIPQSPFFKSDIFQYFFSKLIPSCHKSKISLFFYCYFYGLGKTFWTHYFIQPTSKCFELWVWYSVMCCYLIRFALSGTLASHCLQYLSFFAGHPFRYWTSW